MVKDDLKNKNLIDYVPELEHEKKYDTIGKFKYSSKDKDESQIDTGTNSNKDKIERLEDTLKKLLQLIPNYIIDAYLPPLLGMEEEYDRVTDKDKEDPEKDPDIDTDEGGVIEPVKPDVTEPDVDTGGGGIIEEDEEDLDKAPDIFELDEEDHVTIKPDKSDWSKIIEESYKNDFIDIYEDYLAKMIIQCENYVYDLLSLVDNFVGEGKLADNINSKDLKNQNLSHLTDFIFKSEKSLDLNIRLHKKMYSLDETIFQIRSIRISKEFLKRYSTNKEIEVENNLENRSNALLEESRRVAESKYEENFFNLYKYLNSSVILLGDSLNILRKQGVSIATLSKNGEGNEE